MIKRLSIIIIGVAICAGAGWFFLKPSPQSDIVVLRSPQEPYRVTPADPGGKVISHQGSTVMKMIDELDPIDEEVETVKLPGAEPEMPPVTVEQEPVLADDAALTTEASSPQKPATAPEQIIAVPVKPEVDTTGPEISTNEKTSDTPIVETTENEQQATQLTSTLSAPKPRPTPTKPVILQKSDSAISGEIQLFTVQLAAFRDEEKAEKSAALLNQKHKDRLGGLKLGLMRSDTVNGVSYWRVTTEPAPKNDAAALCDKLNKAGQDCIVKKY